MMYTPRLAKTRISSPPWLNLTVLATVAHHFDHLLNYAAILPFTAPASSWDDARPRGDSTHQDVEFVEVAVHEAELRQARDQVHQLPVHDARAVQLPHLPAQGRAAQDLSCSAWQVRLCSLRGFGLVSNCQGAAFCHT